MGCYSKSRKQTKVRSRRCCRQHYFPVEKDTSFPYYISSKCCRTLCAQPQLKLRSCAQHYCPVEENNSFRHYIPKRCDGTLCAQPQLKPRRCKTHNNSCTKLVCCERKNGLQNASANFMRSCCPEHYYPEEENTSFPYYVSTRCFGTLCAQPQLKARSCKQCSKSYMKLACRERSNGSKNASFSFMRIVYPFACISNKKCHSNRTKERCMMVQAGSMEWSNAKNCRF